MNMKKKNRPEPLVMLCALLVASTSFMPFVKAMADRSPPVIDLNLPTGPLFEGAENVRLHATITDEDGIKQALILIRTLSDGKFVEYEMKPTSEDAYSYTFNPIELKYPGLDFYVTAEDNTGREQSKGFDFDPLRLEIGLPAVTDNTLAANEEVALPEVKKKTNVLWYVVGGIAALGMAAAIGGESGDSTESVSAVFTFK